MIYDQHSAIGRLLLALESKTCSLPADSSVEVLEDSGTSAALHADGGQAWFTEHKIFHLPVDASDATVRRTNLGETDILHRFTVDSSLASELNAALARFALATEGCSEDAATKSNIGGFQSRANLLEPRPDAESDRASSSCRALRGAVLAATEELAIAATETQAEGCVPRARPEQCALKGSEALPLSERLEWLSAHRAQHAEAMSTYGAVAWLNVNRREHSNKLHIHDPCRLSAVYFVSGGEASTSRAPSGHLVFRGGRRHGWRHGAMGGRAANSATHSCLAVPPVAGTLWLFSGAVPHAVLPFHGCDASPSGPGSRGPRPRGREEGRPGGPQPMQQPRISIAINLLDPAPRPSMPGSELPASSKTCCASPDRVDLARIHAHVHAHSGGRRVRSAFPCSSRCGTY